MVKNKEELTQWIFKTSQEVAKKHGFAIGYEDKEDPKFTDMPKEMQAVYSDIAEAAQKEFLIGMDDKEEQKLMDDLCDIFENDLKQFVFKGIKMAKKRHDQRQANNEKNAKKKTDGK